MRLAEAQSTSVFGADPNLLAGAEALRLGRFQEGITLTQAGLNGSVGSDQRASALNNLCAGYVGLYQYDIAIVHCSEALELDPVNWQAYNNRAIAYLGKGLIRLARRDVRRGLQLNPDSDRLHRVEILVEEAAGRRAGRRDSDPRT